MLLQGSSLRRILAVGLLLAGAAFSQTQAINGSIRGRVTDATNAPVPEAKITILNDSTGFTRSMDANEDGLYVFPNLSLGTYDVTIFHAGVETQPHVRV